MDDIHSLLSRPAVAAAPAWLTQAALPAPPLSQATLQAMEPLAQNLFASGLAAQWAASEPEEAFQTWAARGASLRGDAVLGITGTGLHARLRCYSAGPDVSLFIQRDWSPAGDGVAAGNATPSMAIEGAFTLARLLQERAAKARAAGRWPEGRALVLVDDSFNGRLQRWGWSAAGRAMAPGDLVADRDAYLSALQSLGTL